MYNIASKKSQVCVNHRRSITDKLFQIWLTESLSFFFFYKFWQTKYSNTNTYYLFYFHKNVSLRIALVILLSILKLCQPTREKLEGSMKRTLALHYTYPHVIGLTATVVTYPLNCAWNTLLMFHSSTLMSILFSNIS